jgi:hypothetical protein
MKAKPIVPGCKCIILPNKGQLFIGHIVTAITRMPPGTFDRNGHDVSGHWLTDLPPMHGQAGKKQPGEKKKCR